MKTIINIFIMLILLTSISFSQKGYKKILEEKRPAQNIKLIEDQQIKKIVQFIIQYYGSTFKFYHELHNGNYKFEKDKNSKDSQGNLTLYSIKNKSDRDEKIKLKIIKGDDGNLMANIKDIEKYINNVAFKQLNKNFSINPDIQIVDRVKVLFDKMILKNDDIDPAYWRILNRSMTEQIDDQNGDPLALYRSCQAGVIIPYGYGAHSKVLTIDNLYHSLIYFDSDINLDSDDPVNQCYGYIGNGPGQFYNPTGITSGRWENYQDVIYYHIYVADQYNFRIDKVTYYFPANSSTIGSFDNESFTTFGAICPYDVAFVYGRYLEENPGSDNTDKLWVSEAHPSIPSLDCIDENGELKQHFNGYYDYNSNTIYDFLPGTASRISTYFESYKVLSFIDNVRNCLVSVRLNWDGTANYVQNMNGNYVYASDITFSRKMNVSIL